MRQYAGGWRGSIRRLRDATDIGHTIHPHPILSETANFAAETFEATLTDLIPPKRKK